MPLAYIVPHRHMKCRSSRKTSDVVVNHPLRPPCAAGERFVLWLTLYGIRNMNTRAQVLPYHIITREHLLMSRAVAPKTLSNYGTGLLCFMRFCDDLNVPEELQMPAPEWLLSSFLTTRGTRAVLKGTMVSWLQGLKVSRSGMPSIMPIGTVAHI